MLNLNSLLVGIKTAIDGESTLNSLHSKIFYGKAPEGTVKPYGVTQLVGDADIGRFFDGSAIDELLIQISVYSTDFQEVNSLIKAISSKFDRQTLSITDNTFLGCIRHGFRLVTEDTSDVKKKVYHASVDLGFIVQS